ncbi:MAG: methyltransferase type 12 [Sphingomonas bacterium]|uniref:methyltransferase domain-containing protein n=1 Tax=Sphingomonas bacterium TaxID=1895847 RepID=UPI00262260B0|nr:methyltransferase domain-containing protein [Sphingomonas bacterium]MDB5694642.1 methyltransferase type 12 [Sphingomonas bacterium]
MAADFLTRSCPSCGADAPREEMHSTRRAERMSLDELRPYWSGLFKEKVFFSYDRCTQCGLLFAPSFFDRDQLEDLYSAMAPNMDLVPTPALAATQRGYFDAVAKEANLSGGYLELGPDIGWIVRHAAREGAFDKFWLVEPNRLVHDELAGACEGKPHAILTDLDDLSPVPDGSVGLAVMVHVLDHLLDPLAALAAVRAKLKPDGRLMIVTHNEASLLRRVMGEKWPPFCLQHPELYNPKSITGLAKRAGFGSVEVGRSKNYFPIEFMARQAAYTVGLKIDRVPLPKASIGLRLGNMITVAAP